MPTGGLNGEVCHKLHCCPNFLVGKCPIQDDDDCDLGHRLRTRQNTSVYEKAGVQSLPDDVLFELVVFCAQRQVETPHGCDVPAICDDYNNRGCSLSDEICPR